MCTSRAQLGFLVFHVKDIAGYIISVIVSGCSYSIQLPSVYQVVLTLVRQFKAGKLIRHITRAILSGIVQSWPLLSSNG